MPIPPEDLQSIARILAAGYLRCRDRQCHELPLDSQPESSLQARIGRGFTLGPVVTWSPSVSALQALRDSQWSLGLVLGWGQ